MKPQASIPPQGAAVGQAGHIPHTYPRCSHAGLGQHPQSTSGNMGLPCPSASRHKAAPQGGHRRWSNAPLVTAGGCSTMLLTPRGRTVLLPALGAAVLSPSKALDGAPGHQPTRLRAALPTPAGWAEGSSAQGGVGALPCQHPRHGEPSLLAGSFPEQTGRSPCPACRTVLDASPRIPAGPGRRSRIPLKFSKTRSRAHAEPCLAPEAGGPLSPPLSAGSHHIQPLPSHCPSPAPVLSPTWS